MKKQVSKITLALALLTSVAGFSQEPHHYPCATYDAMEQHFKANPDARRLYEQAQKTLEQSRLQAESNAFAKPAATVYTVPVVFHVLHEGGPENISDAAIVAALNQVNADFARTSPDTGSIFAPFKSRYINSDIKFMLAKKDPQGNCINGIVRHLDPKTHWSQSAAQQSFYWPYTWDPTKYLNIYIVNEILPQGTVTGGGIIVGYTYIPGTWPTGNAHDAIVYRYSHLSTNFPNPDARSLSHEIGHWLSLPHTFGNTNNPGVVCSDDGISDTPPTKGNFAACPAASTNTNYTCTSPNPSNPANYFQNVENIMDYSSCPKNFTSGQTTAMRNTLASTVSNRQNLWQNNNLIFTDVNGTIPCAPIAEFLSINGSYTVCAGGNLTMRDYSYNGVITTYQWAADNMATIAASSATQTSINFPLVGVCNVTLYVTNSQGTSMKVRTVTVLDGSPAITGPHFESFENPGLPPDWSVVDVENDSKTWVQTAQVAYHQNYCYFIDGSQQPPGTSDHLQMPMMDVKNNAANVFEFAYAFRRHTSTTSDVLKIQGSRDCGGTWADIVVLPATSMSQNSGGTSTDPFFPNPDEWKVYTISDHPNWLNYINSTNVLVRFNFVEGTSGYGNNIFVDAIQMRTVNDVGVNELTRSLQFGLFPNPTDGVANVNFTLNDAADVKIVVNDILGKEVMVVKNDNLPAGEQSVAINGQQQLGQGIYFVNLSVNGAKMSRKLVIK